MPRKSIVIDDRTLRILKKMGARFKEARLRRNISVKDLARQVGISEGTLYSIEKGSETVSIGAYAAVLAVLGLEEDFELMVEDVDEKKKFWEQNLYKRERATRKITKDNARNL